MANKLDTKSKNILNFRPNIAYVEPDQQEVPIDPIPVGIQPQEAEARIQKVQNLADTVNVLAAAVQAKVDQKAANIKIKLDPKVDGAVIAAMKRRFPDEFGDEDLNSSADDGIFITYDHYRKCKDDQRNYADQVAKKARTSPQDIALARQKLNAGDTTIGGWGTPEASNGGLRPELEPKAVIVEPLDILEFQNYLIRILVNFIWKNFMRPILASAIPLGGGALLPKQLVKLPKSFSKQIKNIKDQGVQVL